MKTSIVIPAYNADAYYRECLTSIQAQTIRDFEIIWVDSASTDDSPARVTAEFPAVHVLELDRNAGYRGGANAGAAAATGEYLVICNQDVRVEPDWLERMIAAMETDPSIGIVAPKILLYEQPAVINEAGNLLHFSGLYGSRGLGRPAAAFSQREALAAVSGCCFLVRRTLWNQLGGFSTDLDRLDTGWHASYEDVDLAWRAQLSGASIVLAPDAVMYHHFERKGMFPERFCSYEWGRTITVIRNYGVTALLLLSPMLLFLEAAMTFYALLKGRAWLRAKRKVWAWCLRHPGELRAMRRRVQAMRRVPDCRIVARMSPVIEISHQFSGRAGRIVQGCFDLFARPLYAMVRALLCLGRGGHRPALPAND